MANGQTANYGLTQWAKTDRILMEEFNSDNLEIDTRLKANADAIAAAQAAMENYGNCKIVCGTYTGSGTYGSSNKNTLTFNGKPLLVVIRKKTRSISNSSDYTLILLRECAWALGAEENYYYEQTVSWEANSVSWYSANAATGQFNTSDKIFCYVALIAADA